MMTKTTTFNVKNMHCSTCALTIEGELEDAGFKCKCSYAKQTLEVEHDGKLDKKKVDEAVKKAGYQLA